MSGSSAKSPRRRRRVVNQHLASWYPEPVDIMRPAERLPLTDDCKHYLSCDQVPKELQKYWYQRCNLWQSYDEADIRMTDAAWFGVTPEPIARAISLEMCSKSARPVLVDLFAGAGGNTIQFARTGGWDRVVAVESDGPTLACAQHNADVHAVSDRITWVHGDSFDFLNRLLNYPGALDARLRPDYADNDTAAATPPARLIDIFASPPWGGLGYATAPIFDLESMIPYGLSSITSACRPLAHALFLPRNGDLRQLANLIRADADEKLHVVQYCIHGSSKGLVAYYPAEHESP